MTRIPFEAQLATIGTFIPEYQFAKASGRRWRFDHASPVHHVAVEIDGGTWTGGRHVTGSGFAKDLEKLNHAAIAGRCVIRVTPQQVDDGTALGLVEQAVAARRAP